MLRWLAGREWALDVWEGVAIRVVSLIARAVACGFVCALESVALKSRKGRRLGVSAGLTLVNSGDRSTFGFDCCVTPLALRYNERLIGVQSLVAINFEHFV